MFRYLFLGAVGYLIYRGLKSVFAPAKDQPEIQGKPPEKHAANIDRSDIEDARYKEIDE